MEEKPGEDRKMDKGEPGGYLNVFQKIWKRMILLSLLAGLVTLLATLLLPNRYKATAVIVPVLEDKKQFPAAGAFASLGIDIGSSAKLEDLETLFNSNDLVVSVVGKHDLWPIILEDHYDPTTGKLKFGKTDYIFRGERESRAPRDWDAIRSIRNRLEVSVNRKSGTVSISFESVSAKGSADIVKYFLEEGKSRIQEEALGRAIINKKFIEGQIGKTVDALTKDRLYVLYGQEVEREMLARNREQFGFRIVDSPRVPDEKSFPPRLVFVLVAMFLMFFVTFTTSAIRSVGR